MPFYFAYGSNMLRARLEGRVGRVEDFGWATLHHYRHAFDKLGRDGTGKGNIVRHVSRHVHGVLYALTHRQVEVLHEFESGYRAVELEVVHQSAGAALRVVTYSALPPRTAFGPSEEYLEYYRRGMREHGLPDAYVRTVLEVHAR